MTAHVVKTMKLNVYLPRIARVRRSSLLLKSIQTRGQRVDAVAIQGSRFFAEFLSGREWLTTHLFFDERDARSIKAAWAIARPTHWRLMLAVIP